MISNDNGNRDPSTVPCETCGLPTPMLATKRCDRCWEIETRLHGYLSTDGGKRVVAEMLETLRREEIRRVMIAAVEAEHLQTPNQNDQGDIAYDHAIDDAVSALRRVKP